VTDNITKLPIRPKQPPKSIAPVHSNYSGCQHVHVLVDKKLAQLECADCHAMLNAIEYLWNVACRVAGWDYESSQIAKVRAELEERKKCRCQHCGRMTEIKRGQSSF
jgi:hypothetical protein